MKKAVLLLVVLALLPGAGIVGQEKAEPGQTQPSQEEMMKRWQEAMTPGDPHKKLAEFAGTWDVETKAWMNGPEGEPSVSRGTSEQKMSMGGRFLQQTVASVMMGQPFEGIGYTGYDNFKKKFVGFWIDNMGTMMLTLTGEMDKGGKTLTMWGTMDEPTTGEKDKKVKYVTRIIDKNKHIFEIYDLNAYGDKKPVMELTYTRKSS